MKERKKKEYERESKRERKQERQKEGKHKQEKGMCPWVRRSVRLSRVIFKQQKLLFLRFERLQMTNNNKNNNNDDNNDK